MILRAMCLLVILAAALLSSSARGSEMFFSTDDVGQMWLQIVDRSTMATTRNSRTCCRGHQSRRANCQGFDLFPGGRVNPAMRIGEYIRTMHLSTVAPQLVPLLGRRTCHIYTIGGPTTVLEYEPLRNRGDPRCTCAGECFLVWAAGSVRHGDAVQIHRMTVDANDERLDARTTDMRRAAPRSLRSICAKWESLKRR